MKLIRHRWKRLGQGTTEYVLLLSIAITLSFSLAAIYQQSFVKGYQDMKYHVMFPYMRAKYKIFGQLLPEPLRKIYEKFFDPHD